MMELVKLKYNKLSLHLNSLSGLFHPSIFLIPLFLVILVHGTSTPATTTVYLRTKEDMVEGDH